MRELKILYEFWNAYRQEPLILCTLVGKSGSAYRKVGAKKLIRLQSGSAGLISGGCLEGLIETEARNHFGSLPFVREFSTTSPEDRFLGFQKGCIGVLKLLFEKVPAGLSELEFARYLPYGRQKGSDVALGVSPSNLATRMLWGELWEQVPQPSKQNWFRDTWLQPIALDVIGCGLDAEPFVELGRTLGWDLRFFDYRRELAQKDRFADFPVHHVSIEDLSSLGARAQDRATILMTHNYEADLNILKGFVGNPSPYLGVLGPQKRFMQLVADLELLQGLKAPTWWRERVAAPAGLFTRGDSMHSIALSICAQVADANERFRREREHVWAVVLAAGASQRFGSAKFLAELQGRTLLEHAKSHAQSLCGRNVVLVSGAHQAALAGVNQDVNTIWNPLWQEGLSGSIQAGAAKVLELDPSTSGILFLPVDQPLQDQQILNQIIACGLHGRTTTFSSHQGVWGSPAFLPAGSFHQLHRLQGERGLKSLWREKEKILLDNPYFLMDIDTKADLDRVAKFSDTENTIGTDASYAD